MQHWEDTITNELSPTELDSLLFVAGFYAPTLTLDRGQWQARILVQSAHASDHGPNSAIGRGSNPAEAIRDAVIGWRRHAEYAARR